MKELKNKLIIELEKKEFPDLEFIFSDEIINNSLTFLREFLKEEKKDFEEKLKIEDKNIIFETFEEESKLSFFWHLLNHRNSTKSSDKLRSIIEEFEWELSDFSNEVSYSKRYFQMLEYCLTNCNLDLEQKKIISESVKNYKIRWINLDLEKQEKLKKINKKLSELSTKFSNNVLDSEKEFEYFLEIDEFLKEFPESDLENAKNLAKKKWKDWYLFDSSASSYIAIIKYCSNSKIRKHFAYAHSGFASKWKFDNREIVLEIINLKDKKAQLLGFKNFSDLSLEFKMAKNSEQVINLLSDLAIKAKPKALKEIEEIKNYFNLDKINSWDMAYYSRILKEKKYSYNDKILKNYFEFKNTQKELFKTVEKLFWIKMEIYNPPLTPTFNTKGGEKYEENIEYYKVYKDWKFISYFIGDYFYNPNKRSWAWADELRDKFWDKKSIVVNVCNFVKSEKWKTLLTLWEVTTLFHEFWHAIHSMLSKSKYSDLSGHWVEWDFVELPSQLMEKWASDDSTIKNISSHFETWEKIPDELLRARKKLKHFWTWNFILWQVTYWVTDMMFYSGEKFENIEELDKKYLEKINALSVFKKPETYKQYASFSHIFAWGYAAWYYSYMWADIIVEDIWAEFKKYWAFDEKTSKNYLENILSAGCINKADIMFKNFMWREVDIKAFLEENWV